MKPGGPHAAVPGRRAVLRGLVLGGVVVGAAMAGMVPLARRRQARLRPPGALPEKNFLAACIKCGQCVQVCPVRAIRLADVQDGYGMGVPYVDARAQACDFSCDALQCVLACPTGALSHLLSRKEEVRMGKALLIGPDTCLARQGQGFHGMARGAGYGGLHRYADIDRWTPLPVAEHVYDLEICDLCVRECPVENAIALRPLTNDPADPRRTPLVRVACVGCGMCEMICPTDGPSIAVAPLTLLRAA